MRKTLFVISFVIALSLSVLAADYDGYIVKLKENPGAVLASADMYSTEASLFSEMDNSEIVELITNEIDGTNSVVSEHLIIKTDDEESLKLLFDMGLVESYEKDFYMELFDYDYEANPYYIDQKWYLDYINVDFAHNAGITGGGVKVGVIDSGVYPHKDIKSNLHPGRGYGVNEETGEIVVTDNDTLDAIYHGTSVAGIIASLCNDKATLGIAFKTTIVPLKVTTASGGVSVSCAIKALYDAYYYYNCDVVNMSFGTSVKSDIFEQEINKAINNGVIVVAATGNYGSSSPGNDIPVNAPMYPAYFENVIGVANAERNGSSLRIRNSSGYNERVDIAAPGTGIMSITNTEDGARQVSGTSFSTPMVTAAAALVKSIKPSVGQAEFTNLLRRSADSSYINESGQSEEKWGAGLLDIEKLIKLVLEGEKYHISSLQTYNGNSFVKVTNLTSSSGLKCNVVIDGYDAVTGLEKSHTASLTLGAGESKEISVTALGFSPENISFAKYTPGDVNGDGTVNILDVSAILRYCAGYDVTLLEAALDANGDGNVNILDASAILRFCAGYDVVLH